MLTRITDVGNTICGTARIPNRISIIFLLLLKITFVIVKLLELHINISIFSIE